MSISGTCTNPVLYSYPLSGPTERRKSSDLKKTLLISRLPMLLCLRPIFPRQRVSSFGPMRGFHNQAQMRTQLRGHTEVPAVLR